MKFKDFSKILILTLFVSSLVNGQDLLLDKKPSEELNLNTNLSFGYTEILTSFTNGSSYPYETFVSSGSGISSAINTTEFGGCASNIIGASAASGSVYLLRVTNLVKNSGAYPKFLLVSSAVGAGAGKSNNKTPTVDGSFDLIMVTTALSNLFLEIGVGNGVATNFSIDDVSVALAVPPTNFTSPTMTTTDYVIENNGCQFIEATGTTYIEMTDTLAAGYYYVTATQIYVSGELNAYNGTSEVAFPQASGISKKLVQLDGVHPLRLQVDNNSNITVTKLSIKRK